jgi:iron(III) transport system substrate-binding protein
MKKVMLSVLGALILASCGRPAAPPPAPEEGNRKLTIYSGRSEELIGPLVEKFRTATGIDVQVKYGNTPELAATILEEGSNAPADIYFAQDPGGLGAIESLLEPLSGELLSKVPDWAKGKTGRWIGLSGRARVVVYNTQRLKESDLPDDIFGFADPKWKGKLGWAPSNSSLQTMVTAMRHDWGEAKTLEWLRGIQANKPKVYPKNGPIVEAVGAGEIDAGFVNHYYLYRYLKERGPEFPARNYYQRAEGPGSLVMVAGAGILSSARYKDAANRFIEFLLSLEAQEYFAKVTSEYPVIAGIPLAEGLVPIDRLSLPDIDVNALQDLSGSQELMRRAGVLP